MIFTYTLDGWKAAGITETEDLSARTERAHFKPGPIHAPVCMATLYFLLEIKNKFCCWTLFFSNEISANVLHGNSR